jgi:hypothetical protein
MFFINDNRRMNIYFVIGVCVHISYKSFPHLKSQPVSDQINSFRIHVHSLHCIVTNTVAFLHELCNLFISSMETDYLQQYFVHCLNP